MLVFIIDGFNLIHQVASLRKSSAPQQDLIRYLRKNKFTGSNNNRVIIVFDGRVDLEALGQRGQFEIFFSGEGTADELIKRKLSRIKNKKETIIVSDDREVRDNARAEGARICRIADFIRPKVKDRKQEDKKEISFSLQHEITQELRKIWLKE